ncbi:MAG: VWA domain-containing protein, partial [Bacteroidota bacterium]
LELIGNFGPGQVTRAELNRENYFLVSVTTEGDTRWVKTFQVGKSTRASTQALGVDGEGNGFLLINQSYWRMNSSGKIQWAGALEGSKGEALASLRISTARRDAYAWALSTKGRYFLTKLNRVDRQTVLWEGRFAGDYPARGLATTQDPSGNIYLMGISGDNSLPGTQLDLTSGSPFFIMKYGPPDGSYLREPVEICGEKPLSLFVPEEVGLNYQWYLNGEPLPGATAARLPLSKAGTYQVRVGNGDCEQLSEPRLVTRCGQDPLAQEMISLASEPEEAVIPPQDPEPSTPTVEEDPYSFQGYANNNLILLLDVSGSMRNLDRLPVLQDALIDLVGYMRPEDRISIITDAGGVKTVLDGVSAANQDQIMRAIDQLASSGQTKGKKALRRAYRVAKQNYIDQGNNRVIMATDGNFAIDPLYDLAEKMNRSEIKLSIFSFGKIIERKSDRLEELARRGGGNYANIRPETVEAALLNEAKAVRRGNP